MKWTRLPMNKPFPATPDSILRRAEWFEIAMWFFLATMSLGLGYTLYKGSSFFVALRQAQFQFWELGQADNVAGFVPFVNGVIATWPGRLAAFPATWADLAAIVLAFLLGMVAFRVSCRSPRGKLLLETSPNSELLRERVRRALELAGSKTSLFVRTDGGDEAGCIKKRNAVYLPASFAQKLYRKLLDNASEQLAFLIVHEKRHGASSDNLLWSWGRSLAFLLTAMSATLIASPVIMAGVAAFPTELVRDLPSELGFGLIMLFIVVLLAFIGSVANGVLPNLAAAREFFADALAVHTPGIGPQALPYEGTYDVSRRSDMAAGWSMTTSGPDRRLHVRGITPRTGALAASTLAVWVLARTLILMVDPMALYGMVWVFDATYLVEIAAMIYSLPRRRTGARDYGLLPWVATMVLLGLIALSFFLIEDVYGSYGIASIIRPSWLAVVAIPPFVVAAGVLMWQRVTVAPRHDLEEIDRLPPRRVGIGPVVQLVAAVPSYVWSYKMGGLALFTWCTALAGWLFKSSYSTHVLVFNAVSLPICAIFAILVAKNLRAPGPKSAAAEAVFGAIMFAPFIYAGVAMSYAAAESPPGNSGPPLNYDLFLQILLSPPADLVATALGCGAVVGSSLLASWEMRYRLVTRSSLFGCLRRGLFGRKNNDQ